MLVELRLAKNGTSFDLAATAVVSAVVAGLCREQGERNVDTGGMKK
jgi:hypothetical protein